MDWRDSGWLRSLARLDQTQRVHELSSHVLLHRPNMGKTGAILAHAFTDMGIVDDVGHFRERSWSSRCYSPQIDEGFPQDYARR